MITAEGATTLSASAMSTMEDIMSSESWAGATSQQYGSVRIKSRLDLSLSLSLSLLVLIYV